MNQTVTAPPSVVTKHQDNLPWPANAQRQSPAAISTSAPAPATASAGGVQEVLAKALGREMFVLDPDLRLAVDDHQRASGMDRVTYIQQLVNEAIRFYLGR